MQRAVQRAVLALGGREHVGESLSHAPPPAGPRVVFPGAPVHLESSTARVLKDNIQKKVQRISAFLQILEKLLRRIIEDYPFETTTTIYLVELHIEIPPRVRTRRRTRSVTSPT